MTGAAALENSGPAGLDGTACLVLGAGGFIGSHLCSSLARAGARVHGFGRRQSYPEALPPMRFTAGEFSDRAALALAVDGAEIVFHLLGGTNPEVSNKDPIADLQINAVASVQLLELCRAAGVRRIVFVSSGGAVYGRQDIMPITETAATDPISAYGINKLMVEKYLQLYAYLGGPSAVSLRVANPYGPLQSPFRRQGLVAAICEAVLSDRPVEIWGNGEVIRDYLFVEDVANALLGAARYDGPHGVFNVGSGEILGRPKSKIVHKRARQADVAANVLDASLATQALDWTAHTGWMEGVLLTATWIEQKFKVR
jgi:UDP-glucose 4-epimerase